jgi:hypothetical protein
VSIQYSVLPIPYSYAFLCINIGYYRNEGPCDLASASMACPWCRKNSEVLPLDNRVIESGRLILLPVAAEAIYATNRVSEDMEYSHDDSASKGSSAMLHVYEEQQRAAPLASLKLCAI